MKHRVPVLLLALLCLAAPLRAQFFFELDWRDLRQDAGHDVLELPGANGGFMLLSAHDTISTSAYDAGLIVTDDQGQRLWSKRYNFGPGSYVVNTGYLRPTPDGNYAVFVNVVDQSNDHGLVLMKVDSSGAVLWAKRYQGQGFEEGGSFTTTSDSGFILCSTTSAVSTGPGGNLLLIKTDASGVPQWAYAYPEPQPQAMTTHFFHVVESPLGGYLVGGRIGGLLMMARISASGGLMWRYSYYKIFPGPIIALPDGFAAAGSVGDRYTLMRTDTAGIPLWKRRYMLPTGHAAVDASELLQLSDGSFVFSGTVELFNTQQPQANQMQAALLKTDSAGTLQWARRYAPSAHSYSCAGLALCGDGGFAMAGSASDTGSFKDVYFARSDSAGKTYCSETMISITTFTDSVDTIPGTATQTEAANFQPLPVIVTGLILSDTLYCHNALGLAENSQRGNFLLYPNPSAGTFTLSCDLPPEILATAELKILSLEGKSVKTLARGTIENGATISLSDLAPGMYFYLLRSENETLFSGKLIIAR